MHQNTLDSLVAGSLALALIAVLAFDKIVPPPDQPVSRVVQQPIDSWPDSAKPAPAVPPRLAISHAADKDKRWDDMALLLDTLGQGYQHTRVPVKDLYYPKTFENFDILFLTCSDEGNDLAVAENVRAFVLGGGTLYASDWRFQVVADAFPELVDPKFAVKIGNASKGKRWEFKREMEGNFDYVMAEVLDPGLEDMLGQKKVKLNFDKDQWKPAAFNRDRVHVLMEANYETMSKARARAPLLVKFAIGKGNVIFTSFHNKAQPEAVEENLLKYLVFSAVTANIESQVNQSMVQGGFSPQKSNLLSASSQAKVTHVFRGKKAGKVRFVLGFQSSARLKMTVTSPEGKTTTREGTSTFTIEEISNVPGEWRYTITALEVPSPNFPFTVTVGEPK